MVIQGLLTLAGNCRQVAADRVPFRRAAEGVLLADGPTAEGIFTPGTAIACNGSAIARTGRTDFRRSVSADHVTRLLDARAVPLRIATEWVDCAYGFATATVRAPRISALNIAGTCVNPAGGHAVVGIGAAVDGHHPGAHFAPVPANADQVRRPILSRER